MGFASKNVCTLEKSPFAKISPIEKSETKNSF